MEGKEEWVKSIKIQRSPFIRRTPCALMVKSPSIDGRGGGRRRGQTKRSLDGQKRLPRLREKSRGKDRITLNNHRGKREILLAAIRRTRYAREKKRNSS